MKYLIAGAGIMLALSACAKKALLPDVHPVPENMAMFQAPALYVPPPVPELPPLPPPQKPPTPNERRYTWQDGEAVVVPVGIGYPTMVRFQTGEKITSIMDGDREYLTETEAQAAPATQTPQDKNGDCFHGARWQWCRAVSGSHDMLVEHIVFTATHAGHKNGAAIFTDQRSYYLELQAVKVTKTRLVSWTVPPPPPRSTPPKAPGLFPDLAQRRQLHVGYTYTIPNDTPDWTPIRVWSDIPTQAAAKMYLQFSPVMLHQRMPVLRGINEVGQSYLVNARQYGSWIVVDELAPRLELRRGTGKDAQVVIITREKLTPINCPGEAQCPVWPAQ